MSIPILKFIKNLLKKGKLYKILMLQRIKNFFVIGYLLFIEVINIIVYNCDNECYSKEVTLWMYKKFISI